ncbi:MAG TPA: glycosyltransferase [Gallionella sp.]|nr:glycosyltransferase [Gallionella sp.]
MKIVIDLQGAQGCNRHRGIGRYTLSLAQAIVRHRGDHEVILALNGLFPDTIEPIRAAFDGLLPRQNICVWEAPGPVCSLDAGNDWRRQCAELVREAFLARFQPDIVLVSSLFEGLTDDGVSSVGALNTVPTAVVLYDLIPLIHPQLYLEKPETEAWYRNKIEHLRRAGLALAISESSRQEGIRHLGFSPDSVFNISTAADSQFEPGKIDAGLEAEFRRKYGLQRPFVMYTGGMDHRKNIEGLIRAYAKLPGELRASHQLAVVCNIPPQGRAALESLAKEQGLRADELVLTGFVPEEDLVTAYNLCKVFAFPSWHEGFGLPALEAMSCGKAVIASNTSSLPEVVGREDALFDPRNAGDMAAKLAKVLLEDDFRLALEKNGLERAKLFSWDASARRAIAAIEAWHLKKNERLAAQANPRRPKLAFVSPLPPVRSGISDYSAELLPELARHYDIDVIVSQEAMSDSWVKANCQIRNVDWLREHAGDYDRVLYHFGNSAYHEHMFGLLDEIPGVVVLHDFYLSSVVAYMEGTGYRPGFWEREIFNSHGYAALRRRFREHGGAQVIWHYPCNLGVVQRALGVVVHSDYSRRLARQWIGEGAGDDWAVVPLLRAPVAGIDRGASRQRLKFDDRDLVICSFGVLGQTKLSHRLLDAWLASGLAGDPRCKLVFAGDTPPGEYGDQLRARIDASGLGKRIQITGWVDAGTFRDYLAAADVAVQLRTLSRGESSAALLDCMNYGLPTIVNANGSIADVQDDGVWKLPDEFSDAELVAALETLSGSPERRAQLGRRAREIVVTGHQPDHCAGLYAHAIERAYEKAANGLAGLTCALAKVEPLPAGEDTWLGLAQSVARSLPVQPAPRQLLVDVSELVQRDVKSGIQRVVRSILSELLLNPPDGFRVEPVYATTEHGYKYARQFTLGFLECPSASFTDEPVDYQAGDVFLGLDLTPHVTRMRRHCHRRMRNAGVKVEFVVYDLLPITLPKAFGEGALASHTQWMDVVAESDGVVCISKAVADEVKTWMAEHHPSRLGAFDIRWFHLGADIESSVPSTGMPETASLTLRELAKRPAFLMVGTLEPRKGHLQTLAAFEQLWAAGVDANLVIVGKRGWLTDTLVGKLRSHCELDKRLFWLEGISDQYLEEVYAASTCLIGASEGEGFGLPLIEAAQHGLPIIARDIPVFREVAGEHAFYFAGSDAASLASAVNEWMALDRAGQAPQSGGMPWLTWRESAQRLVEQVIY